MKLLPVLLLVSLCVGCGYSKSTTPPSPGTTPVISKLTPNSAAANTSVDLTVDGTSFAGGAVIKFNGQAQTTTRVSGTQLKATIPDTATATAGVVPVTVTNPATPGGPYGGGTTAVTSAPMNFTIN